MVCTLLMIWVDLLSYIWSTFVFSVYFCFTTIFTNMPYFLGSITHGNTLMKHQNMQQTSATTLNFVSCIICTTGLSLYWWHVFLTPPDIPICSVGTQHFACIPLLGILVASTPPIRYTNGDISVTWQVHAAKAFFWHAAGGLFAY
jgi:hypothetical protein